MCDGRLRFAIKLHSGQCSTFSSGGLLSLRQQNQFSSSICADGGLNKISPKAVVNFSVEIKKLPLKQNAVKHWCYCGPYTQRSLQDPSKSTQRFILTIKRIIQLLTSFGGSMKFLGDFYGFKKPVYLLCTDLAGSLFIQREIWQSVSPVFCVLHSFALMDKSVTSRTGLVNPVCALPVCDTR